MRVLALLLLACACKDPPPTASQLRRQRAEAAVQVAVAACRADGGSPDACELERLAAVSAAGCRMQSMCLTNDPDEKPGSVMVCP